MPAPRVPTTERVASIGLIVVLVVAVAAAVLPGLGPQDTTEPDQTHRPTYALPDNAELVDAWQSFPEDRMYEKINGRAVLFQEHGAVKLETASITVDDHLYDVYLYTMKSPDAALGVYLAETGDGAEPLELGDRASHSRGLVRVLKGSRYLGVMALEQNAPLDSAVKLAEALADQFKQRGPTKKSLLDALPETHRVEGTASANPESAVGLETLANSYSASYTLDNVEFGLLLKNVQPGTAPDELEKITDELREFGATELDLAGDRLTGKLFDQQILIVHRDNILYGVYGAVTPDQAQKCLQWSIENTKVSDVRQ